MQIVRSTDVERVKHALVTAVGRIHCDSDCYCTTPEEAIHCRLYVSVDELAVAICEALKHRLTRM